MKFIALTLCNQALISPSWTLPDPETELLDWPLERNQQDSRYRFGQN